MFVLNILFVLLCATSIRGSEKCALGDASCTTANSAKTYNETVAGKEGSWESSDPLTLDEFAVETSSLSVELYNPVLTGMQQCYVTLDTIKDDYCTVLYNLACPQLIMESEYKMDGSIGDVSVNGEGSCRVTRDLYNINFVGTYANITAADGDTHVQINDYNVTYVSDDKISYEMDGLENSEEVLAILNDNNGKEMDELVGQEVMSKFMKKFMKNINDYMCSVPLNDIYNLK